MQCSKKKQFTYSDFSPSYRLQVHFLWTYITLRCLSMGVFFKIDFVWPWNCHVNGWRYMYSWNLMGSIWSLNIVVGTVNNGLVCVRVERACVELLISIDSCSEISNLFHFENAFIYSPGWFVTREHTMQKGNDDNAWTCGSRLRTGSEIGSSLLNVMIMQPLTMKSQIFQPRYLK